MVFAESYAIQRNINLIRNSIIDLLNTMESTHAALKFIKTNSIINLLDYLYLIKWTSNSQWRVLMQL